MIAAVSASLFNGKVSIPPALAFATYTIRASGGAGLFFSASEHPLLVTR